MKKKINIRNILFLLSFLLIVSCSDEKDEGIEVKPPVEGVTVKAMTYNIYSGALKGMEGIAKVINEVDPDIVGIQEFETNSKMQPMDAIEKLLSLTQMEYAYFAKTHNLDRGEYGNLTLSKYELTEKETYDLGVVVEVGSFPRSLGVVKLEKEGKAFYFANTHLDHLGDDLNRIHQVEGILKHLEAITDPIILVGDFNAIQGSDPLNALLERFTLGCADGDCGLTSSAPSPIKAIDYLMYTPADAVTPAEYNVYYDAFSESDHFPVVASFIIHNE